MAGQKHGRLLVLQRAGTAGRVARWRCLCDCGREAFVRGKDLRTGNTVSCGCFHRERQIAIPRKHGAHGTPEYRIWADIRQRCLNPKRECFKNYGGRGIGICAPWRDSFAVFLAHVGPRPSGTHSIDRIDNSRGYEPGNVRWATPTEQASNTRANRKLEHAGERLTVNEWARRTGIRPSTIAFRLKVGWSVAEALTSPVRTNGHAASSRRRKVLAR